MVPTVPLSSSSKSNGDLENPSSAHLQRGNNEATGSWSAQGKGPALESKMIQSVGQLGG